jgi:hypothetical protein
MTKTKVFGPWFCMMSLLVVTLTAMCIERASATQNAPNAMAVPYSLASGATSSPITPAVDTPVFVIANSSTDGDRGVGSMSLEHASGLFLEWSGLSSVTVSGAPVITGGFTSAAGTKMLQIDYETSTTGVWLIVDSADTFAVKNDNSFSVTGSVTIIW